MIICSCNVLTDHEVIEALDRPSGPRPRTPGQVYRCLGCRPQCGRCVATVARIVAERRGDDPADGSSCAIIGCATCPGHATRHEAAHQDREPVEHNWLIAAE